MGDSDPSEKKPAVPLWQAELKDSTPTEGDLEPQSPSRETLVEQAKKFLEEDEVRNESTDKKISFLESKGLNSEEIQSLIGVTRQPDASASAPSAASPTSLQPRPTYSAPPPPPPRSIPPVITYPEFLTTPAQPTPLVTMSRLRTTLYLFGGFSALLYGTNNYLVTPMVAALTDSRLSLASTASSNLSKLISKLESVVSELPLQQGALVQATPYQDEEESDEDPTELFHRDVGVQTSTPPTPRSTSPSRNSSGAGAVAEQETRLRTLSSRISSLVEDSRSEGQETSDLTTAVAVLSEYLSGLAYVTPTYGYGVGGYSGLNQNNKEDDEIGRVKASIRGVKGVLLSTRSFPAVARTVK